MVPSLQSVVASPFSSFERRKERKKERKRERERKVSAHNMKHLKQSAPSSFVRSFAFGLCHSSTRERDPFRSSRLSSTERAFFFFPCARTADKRDGFFLSHFFIFLTVTPNGLFVLVWLTCCLLGAAEEEAALLALKGLSLKPTLFLAPIIFCGSA